MGRVVTALLALLTATSALAAKGSDCVSRVASNVYRCTVTPQSGTPFEDCLRFATPGSLSDAFDVTPDQLGVTLGCTCKAGGSRKRPKFGASPAFECNAEDFAFEGIATKKGKAIVKGFASTAAGASFVFSCKLDPACPGQ